MKRMSYWIEDLVKRWSRSGKKKRQKDIIILLALFTLSWLLVYYTGGSKYVYAHVAYLPVLYSALCFGTLGGLIGGIVAGILMGPFMPLDVELGQMQSFFNWFSRMLFYIFIGSTVGIIFEILFKQFSRVEKLAFFDQLVNLPNKLSLQKELDKTIESASDEESFTVFTLAIDNYLDILSTIGYDLAEIFWNSVVKHIYGFLNNEDITLYSYNENTYQILYPGIKDKEAVKWIENFSELLNYPININGIPIYLKTNLGCAFYPDHGKSGEEIIQRSYIAMDNARKRKVNFLCYQDIIVDRSQENLLLLGEVKESLEQEDFLLYYQPKLCLKTNKIIGVEGLIRWNHPERGIISPGMFLPEMENTDLINQLTYWVLEKAISDLREWEERGLPLNVSINISAHNLKHYRFISEIGRIVNENPGYSSLVEMEITETEIMEDYSKIKHILKILINKGFTLSIDDFGTGYSSLAYLNHLPVEIIKIDQSFMRNMTESSGGRVIVYAAIRMAHALGKKVIAEGVETLQELELLKEMDCDYIQGYYISRPVPKEEIPALLKEYS